MIKSFDVILKIEDFCRGPTRGDLDALHYLLSSMI